MRNSIAHPLVPLTPPVTDQSGGATARGGGEAHGHDDNERKLRNSPFKRVPEHLRTNEELPEGREGTREVEAALATKLRDGNNGGNVEKMTWTSRERPGHQNGFHMPH